MRLLLLSALISLSACAGQHTHQAQTQINNRAEAELNAWEKVAKENKEQCPVSTNEKPLPASMALKKHDCWANLVGQNVAPVAYAPDLLAKHLINAKQVAMDYKKGRIDRDEVNFAHEKLWVDYITALDSRAQKTLMRANQQDQQLAREQQQYFQNLSRELREAETERHKANMEALKNNKIKTTNCYGSGNHLNCTTM